MYLHEKLTQAPNREAAEYGSRLKAGHCDCCERPCISSTGLKFQRNANMPSRSRGICARGLRWTARPRNQRAQGRPGARCTRGLVCNCAQKTRTRAYRFSGSIPAFPAQWLYGLLRALPSERLSCHRHHADTSASLDASTAASGPHDFAVRFTPHSSVMASASTATCPNVRDDGRRPSGGTGWR